MQMTRTPERVRRRRKRKWRAVEYVLYWSLSRCWSRSARKVPHLLPRIRKHERLQPLFQRELFHVRVPARRLEPSHLRRRLRPGLPGARSSRCVTVYLKNLAAADFLLSLCLPFRIARHAGALRPALRSYCSFGAPAFYLNMYASILFMGYIATHRYLKIVHPLGTPLLQSVRAAHVISAATWLVLLAVAATYVILSLLAPEAPAPPGAGVASCDDLQSGPLKRLYKAVHGFSAAVFLLVLLALLFFYGSTSRRLAAAQRRRAASSTARKLLKSRRNILALVSVFCVCFVPYHLVRLPYAVLKPTGCSARLAFFYLKDATVAVSVLNVCLDPLIYFLFCDVFREQVGRGRARSSGERTSGGRTPRKMSDLPSSGFLT